MKSLFIGAVTLGIAVGSIAATYVDGAPQKTPGQASVIPDNAPRYAERTVPSAKFRRLLWVTRYDYATLRDRKLNI